MQLRYALSPTLSRLLCLLLLGSVLAACGGGGGDSASGGGGGGSGGGGGLPPDTQAPLVLSTTPAAGATVASPATVTVTFSEPMDPATLTSASFALLNAGAFPMSGSVAYAGNVLTFTPDFPLPSDSYVATLSGAADVAGNPLALTYSWGFTVDADAPQVTSLSPSPNATFVAVDSTVVVTFNEALDPASVTADSVTLTHNGLPVTTTRSLAGTQLTLTPAAPLARNATYTVTLGAGLTDAVGNAMGSAYSFSFSTVMPYFSNGLTIRVGSDPEAVAIGDVTGDGRNDIVLTTISAVGAPDAAADYKLVVVPQAADGTLGAPVRYTTASSAICGAWSLGIGDVTGDGKNDVVVGLGSCGIEIFERGSDGTLTSSGTLATGNGGQVRLADLNQDGRLDVVGAGSGTGFTVWYQQAGGGLAAGTTYAKALGGARDLEVGDLTGDGIADLVIMSVDALWVVPQPSLGTFGAVVKYTLAVSGEAIALADMNADARLDLTLSGGGNQPDARVSRIFQQANGTLGGSLRTNAYQIPESVAVGDIDGNGYPDAAVVHPYYSRLGFMLQGSDGQFGSELLSPLPYGQNANSGSLALGDINGDGLLDAVTVASDGGKLVVYPNTGP